MLLPSSTGKQTLVKLTLNDNIFRMQGNEPRPTETMLEKMDITDKNGSP